MPNTSRIPKPSAGSPLDLKAVRQKLLEKHTLCRTTVNEHIAKIKRLFKWGVENELVPSTGRKPTT